MTVLASTVDGVAGAGPSVLLASGEEASGLASMVAYLLRDNLRDFRSRSVVARLTRGDVVLVASDRDVAVTLSFQPGQILIAEGAVPGAPMLAGKWLDLAKLCSGQRSPLAAVASGDLRVTSGRGMRAAVGAGFALSVPKSFYEENREALVRRRGAELSLALLAAVVLTAYLVRKPERRRRRRRAHASRSLVVLRRAS